MRHNRKRWLEAYLQHSRKDYNYKRKDLKEAFDEGSEAADHRLLRALRLDLLVLADFLELRSKHVRLPRHVKLRERCGGQGENGKENKIEIGQLTSLFLLSFSLIKSESGGGGGFSFS